VGRACQSTAMDTVIAKPYLWHNAPSHRISTG
jgi:hypothetical protein